MTMRVSSKPWGKLRGTDALQIFWVPVPRTLLSDELRPLIQLLNADEKHVYSRYRVDHKRVEFLVGRALVKQAIGSWLGLNAEQVKITKNIYGKPFVEEELMKDRKIYFNLTNTSSFVCALFGRHEWIGIDAEYMQEGHLDVMNIVFTPQEVAFVLGHSDPQQRRQAFYRIWTRKEAIMKAEGLGFAMDPLSFQVPTPEGIVDHGRYVISTFTPMEGIMLSVAYRTIDGCSLRVKLRKLDWRVLTDY